jgi:threonine synthase
LNSSEVEPWENPETIAGGVRDEYPYDIELALPAFRESKGSTVTVSDKEIIETMRLLSQDEGVFVEPTGAVASAGLEHLVEEKTIDKDETVVAMLTGSGLKDPGYLGKELPRPPIVDADSSEVLKLL